MEPNWLNEAVTNNAVWCDAIASSHGIPTNWDESVWLSEKPMPPLYPNIVTLKSGGAVDKAIGSIDSRLPLGWGIKDSFGELELEVKGFSLAFHAHWYFCAPNQSVFDEKNSRLALQTVKTQTHLNRWVSAWGEAQGIFNILLLERDDVELVYIERDDRVVSGLATNLSGCSVGISNTFGKRDDILGCIASVAERHPDKGIVGYGDKDELVGLSRIGFQEIGDLRVWLRR